MNSETQLIPTPGVFGENDNFLLERELGRGGMGGVYLGRDKMLDRPVAVKVMLKEYGADAEFVTRFKNEAQASARLIHPNIAQIYSYGISDGMPYIAMELVAGGSLDRVMRVSPGKTDIPRMLKICEQVAQALRCAADQGVVHGDIKPENILLDPNGNAKLVDFGLAGMQKDTDEIWGTPYYIAPEKLRKEPIDYRADMYNLGGSLYHALTGVAPFEGADSNEVVRARFFGPAKSMREIRPEIPVAVDNLVLKMLAFDPKDRFPTFEALLAEFKNVMSTGLTDAQPPVTTNGAAPSATSSKPTLKRPGKKLVMKRRGAGLAKPAGNSEGNEGGNDEAPAEGDAEATTPTKKPGMMNLTSGTEDQPDEDEANDNVGRKILLGVVGAVVGLGLLFGGIAWYMSSQSAGEEAARKADLLRNISKAKEAISNNRQAAAKFLDEVTKLSGEATKSCEDYTKIFVEKVPEFADSFKPAVSAELMAAIALTNQPVVVEGATNAVAAASNAVPQSVAAPAAAVAAAAPAKIKGFRPPKDDEADPNSPEGEKYLKEKKEWEEQQKKAEAAKAAEPVVKEEPAPEPEKAESGEMSKELRRIGEAAVANMHDLWNRAYACQAAEIRIRIEIKKILELCESAEAITGTDKESMTALAEISRNSADKFGEVKGGKDVETIRKGVGFINSKGKSAITKTGNELFQMKAENDRKLKREAELKEAEERRKRLEEERQKLIADETEQAKTKFQVISSSDAFNVLAWDASIRQLTFLDTNFKTAEGNQAIKDEIAKIKDMKSVHEIFIKNMKGYHFRKSKLGKEKAYVVDVDASEIKLAKPSAHGKETKFKITWAKFFKDYHGNLNELFLQYVDNGRKNCRPTLSLREWSDAMCGAALILKFVCAEDATSAKRAEDMVKEVAKQYDQYQPVLKKMFPEIELGESTEE